MTENSLAGSQPVRGTLPRLRDALADLLRDKVGVRMEQRGRERELRIVETLAVGPRKQLLLVSCGGEQFLVGTGADAVGSIVRVAAQPGCGCGHAGDVR